MSTTNVETTSNAPVLYTPGRLIGYGDGAVAKYNSFSPDVQDNLFDPEKMPTEGQLVYTNRSDPYLIGIIDGSLWDDLFENWFVVSLSFYNFVSLEAFDSENTDDTPPNKSLVIRGLTKIVTSILDYSEASSGGDQVIVDSESDTADVLIIEEFFIPQYPGVYSGKRINTAYDAIRRWHVTNESADLLETIRFKDEMDQQMKDEVNPDPVSRANDTILRGVKGVFTNIDPSSSGSIGSPNPVRTRTVIQLGIAERDP